MPLQPGILARGPWPADAVRVRWRDDVYEASADEQAAADDAIAALHDRGSPSHDGLAARLAAYRTVDRRPELERTGGRDPCLELELQPMRWGLRLVPGDALGSISVQCVVRDHEGCWLAGRRSPWVATWAGRWALGAGGAVEVGEDPVEALSRELEEEWGLRPTDSRVEALLCLPNRLIMLVGQAWVPAGAEITRDHEHDAHAWWPPDPDEWPDEADPVLRRMAKLLA